MNLSDDEKQRLVEYRKRYYEMRKKKIQKHLKGDINSSASIRNTFSSSKLSYPFIQRYGKVSVLKNI